MIDEQRVASHYATGRLLDALREGLAKLGKTPETVGLDDLAAADEFHVGGRQATLDLHEPIGWRRDQHLLDVGCGIGGPARVVASRFGVRVTGIDLTPEYVEVGNALSAWVGLGERVRLVAGSALQLPFDDGSFDGGTMIHVGMNIADKAALFAGVCRVLGPGSSFALFDVMRSGKGELHYPVPWATTAETSRLATPDEYARALDAAGFELVRTRDRRDFALEFFERMRERMAGASAPPPLGPQLVMGPTAADKIRHLVQGIAAGVISPVEMVAVKRT